MSSSEPDPVTILPMEGILETNSDVTEAVSGGGGEIK